MEHLGDIEIPEQTHPLLFFKVSNIIYHNRKYLIDYIYDALQGRITMLNILKKLKKYGSYYVYLLCLNGYYTKDIFEYSVGTYVIWKDICHPINMREIISYEPFIKYKPIIKDLQSMDVDTKLSLDIGEIRIQLEDYDNWSHIVKYINQLEMKSENLKSIYYFEPLYRGEFKIEYKYSLCDNENLLSFVDAGCLFMVPIKANYNINGKIITVHIIDENNVKQQSLEISDEKKRNTFMRTLDTFKSFGSIIAYINGRMGDSIDSVLDGFYNDRIGVTSGNSYMYIKKPKFNKLIPYQEFLKVYEETIQHENNPLLYVDIGIKVQCKNLYLYDILYNEMERYEENTGLNFRNYDFDIHNFYKYYRSRRISTQKSANSILRQD